MQNATWLVSREIAEAAGPWDASLQYDQDGEYFARVVLASEGTRFVPEGRVFYRVSDGNRISFIAALQFIQNCWLICAAMAPARIPRKLRRLREDLSQFILPPRRSERLYPRAVKIKMSAYPKKRSQPAGLMWKRA